MIAVEDPLLEDSLSNGDKEQIVRRHRIISTALIGAACVVVSGGIPQGYSAVVPGSGVVSAQDFGAGDAELLSVHPEFTYEGLGRAFSADDAETELWGPAEIRVAAEQNLKALNENDGEQILSLMFGALGANDLTVEPAVCKKALAEAMTMSPSLDNLPDQSLMVTRFPNESDDRPALNAQIVHGGQVDSNVVSAMRQLIADCDGMQLTMTIDGLYDSPTTLQTTFGIKEIPFDLGLENQFAMGLKQVVSDGESPASWQFIYFAMGSLGENQITVYSNVSLDPDEPYLMIDEYQAVHYLGLIALQMSTLNH